MNKPLMKKATAAVMAFALIGGALPTGNTSLFGSPSIAIAEEEIIDTYDHVNDPDHLDNFDPVSFSEKTGVLLLNGKVNKDDVRQYANSEIRDKIKKVYCTRGTVLPSDCSYLFDMFEAETFDLSNADTSNVHNMARMFYTCRKAESLDLSSWDTSNVTDMSYMFSETNFVSLDLSNWNTSNVNDMSFMFWCAHELKSLDLKHFNTSNVKTMEFMFADCDVLESLYISNFDTSKVTTMKQMFFDCHSLTALDVSSFNTSKVTSMYWMFGNCEKLASIDVTNFDTSHTEKRTGSYAMFCGCSALEPDIYHISGQSISLDGSLGMNFYVWGNSYLGSSNPENGSKAVLSGPNGDILISDLSSVKEPGGKYKFTYPVNATQAKEKVTLKIYDKDDRQLILCKENGSNYMYSLSSYSQGENSVQNYITELKEERSYKTDAKLQILVSALENYFKAAENYFKGAENEVKEYKDEYAVTVEPFAPEFGEDVKISLVLDSATAVRIYTNASGVKIDGNDITPKTTKYGKCYEIANIPAHQLLGKHTLTIGDKNYQFSPMSYVYRTVNSRSASELLKNTAWAAYLYANAANAYIK